MILRDSVAVVTGGSRGVGAGGARELARQGARVFATGRTIGEHRDGDGELGMRCDHTIDAEVETAFTRILDEADDGRCPRPLTLADV